MDSLAPTNRPPTVRLAIGREGRDLGGPVALWATWAVHYTIHYTKMSVREMQRRSVSSSSAPTPLIPAVRVQEHMKRWIHHGLRPCCIMNSLGKTLLLTQRVTTVCLCFWAHQFILKQAKQRVTDTGNLFYELRHELLPPVTLTLTTSSTALQFPLSLGFSQRI